METNKKLPAGLTGVFDDEQTSEATFDKATVAGLLERIETYGFTCEAGHLTDCVEFKILKELAAQR